jgi:hypothetical protein
MMLLHHSSEPYSAMTEKSQRNHNGYYFSSSAQQIKRQDAGGSFRLGWFYLLWIKTKEIDCLGKAVWMVF